VAAIGQTLFVGAEIYSAWMPREADYCVFWGELIDKSGSPTLTVTIYHKNIEDDGDGDAIGTPNNFTLSGTDTIKSLDATAGLKEMVRFKFAVTGTSGDWIHYRMLTPVWYDAATI